MRLSVLVLLGVACLAATTHRAEALRTKRTIGSWFSKLWKRWKKEPEPDYGYQRPVYAVAVPQPVYHRPPVKPHYGPPPIRPQPTYQAPAIQVHFVPGGHGGGGHGGGGHGGGGHGGGGHGGGGHGGGGHGGGGVVGGGHGGGGGYGGGGHGIGGHGKGGPVKGGHGIGGHGIGGPVIGGHGKGHGKGGHGKGGGGIPHGFGPVKHSDVVHSGQSYHGPPPSVGYSGPPPADDYGPPPVETYAPPPTPSYIAPPPALSNSYSAPIPVVSDSYSGPGPVISDSYSAPSAPIHVPAVIPHIVHEPIGPIVSDLSNDYRAPPSFPPPMAAHGSSSSSYLEGSFQPSQQLPVEQILPAPPAPLYDLPVGPGSFNAIPHGVSLPLAIPDGAPAHLEVLPPAPLALETTFEEPRSAGGAGAHVIVASGGGGPTIQGAYSAPALDLTYGSQLGVEDPIIEIVFQDGDPIPAPPPPIFDPELFALQEEDVEVYFIEYAPGDNLDDLAALSLDGAQPGILHDLPQELPFDVRSQLLDSGILEDAEIQVVNLDDALSQGVLDVDTRTALEAVYGAESRLREIRVDAPEEEDGEVKLKVHRLAHDQRTPKSTAELLSSLQNYREGRYLGVVQTNSNDTTRYLPVTIDGDRIPLPNRFDLSGQKVTEVLVVANSDDDDDENQGPPSNTNDPEDNLVAETSNLRPIIVAAEAIADGIDRQWHGDPNDWRPIWN